MRRCRGPLSIARYGRCDAGGLRPARHRARALARPFDGHDRLPAPRGRAAEAGAQPRAVRAADGAARAARARRSARARAKARDEGAAGMHEIALALLQARDLGRHAPAPAARDRVRARKPDAPGPARLCAQVRGARRCAAGGGRSDRGAGPARHRRRGRRRAAAGGARDGRADAARAASRAAPLRPLDAGRAPEDCMRELRDFLSSQR